MKKLIAISAITLVMISGPEAGAAAPRTSAVVQPQVVEPAHQRGSHVSVAILNRLQELEQQKLLAEKQAEIDAKLSEVNGVINQLKDRIGKTWYVFSGASPRGWDCSGLVYWAYEQLGIDVPHSANKLGHLNAGVKDPVVGDIVVWAYSGSTSYYHAAIYIGDGKVIHAGFRKGTSTQIISLDDPSFKGSTVKFVRLLQIP